MEPVTAIVTALALGAAAGLKDVTETVVTETYSALKKLIESRYKKVNLTLLESAPQSTARQKVVEEDLKEVGAGEDLEVLENAQRLLRLVLENSPRAASAIGVDLKNVETASLAIDNVISSGGGVRINHLKTPGSIEIRNVRAGVEEDPSSKKKTKT
jgi:hypothetical protein